MTSTERSQKRRALMTASERTAERSYYAVKRRADLVRLLAPDLRCAHCGVEHDVRELVIDHREGRLWLVDEVSPSVRAARYHREYRAGIPMRALCLSCSGRIDGGRRYHGARG